MPHVFVARRLVAESFCGVYSSWNVVKRICMSTHFKYFTRIVSRISFALLFLLLPHLSHAELIESFDVELTLNEDSSLNVTETIKYVFTGDKHGIFRYIPTRHPEKSSTWYKEHYIDIEVQGVTMDGNPVPYEAQDESSQLYLKIGDPVNTINGKHTYVIEYAVTGAVSYRPVTELYWNITGNEWDVPIKQVSATLSGLQGIFSAERACYKGSIGISDSCGKVEADSTTGTVTFKTGLLKPQEGMTIAQGLNPTKVEKVVLEKNKAIILWIVGLCMWFGGLTWFVYGYKTAYKTGNTIIPEYEPYPGVKPMYAGLLMDGRLDPRDITACIVYLAEQGYLKIKKIEKKVMFFFEVDDYEITLVRPVDESLSAFEKDVLLLLLGTPLEVGAHMELDKLRTLTAESAALKQRRLAELRSDLAKDLEASGFFKATFSATQLVTGIVGGIALFIFTIGPLLESFPMFGGLEIVLFVSGIIVLASLYRRRTRKGYEALDHLHGFKDFLNITDKERYDFHNAPEKSPEQFMQYLPYAIAFGVEEKWAEVFKDITIPNPGWYDGGGAGSFSAINLSTSLGAFSTAFTAPSGGSGSGSGGGGFSGGGGGGGGGGSW